jgi:hypothetical protein
MYTGYPLHWREFGRVPLMWIVVERKPVMPTSRWRSPWWSTIASTVLWSVVCIVALWWLMARFPINETEVLRIYTLFGALELFQYSGKQRPRANTNNHDCTFKESLYSTHPYLTYSNKKSTLPVMTKFSIHGYREKIGTSALLRRCCGEEQRWIYIPIRCPWMQFEQVSPPTKPKMGHHPTHHLLSQRRLYAIWQLFPITGQGFWITTTFCQFHILLNKYKRTGVSMHLITRTVHYCGTR